MKVILYYLANPNHHNDKCKIYFKTSKKEGNLNRLVSYVGFKKISIDGVILLTALLHIAKTLLEVMK